LKPEPLLVALVAMLALLAAVLPPAADASAGEVAGGDAAADTIAADHAGEAGSDTSATGTTGVTAADTTVVGTGAPTAPAGEVPVDTTAALPDSAVQGGGLSALLAGQSEGPPPALSTPLIKSWQRTPKASLSASVRKVDYGGELSSQMLLSDQSTFNQRFSYGLEEYRRQEKSVDRRSGSFDYRAGESLPVELTLNSSWDWSEDVSVNTSGRTNLIKSDTRRARLELRKNNVFTGPLRNEFLVRGNVSDQKGENQGRRNDISDADLSGGISSRCRPVRGIALTGSLWEQTAKGERSLGESTSPSHAAADSQTGGVFYRRGIWEGHVTARRATFDKWYLDYKRDENGLVDTTGLSESEKLVEELEQRSATALEWENRFRFWRFGVRSLLARKLDEHGYQISKVGRTEEQEDHALVDLSFRYGPQDSLVLSYEYSYHWDNQIYQGGSGTRGRQTNERREVQLALYHRLFPHTRVTGRLQTYLDQDIAEIVQRPNFIGPFNENDRDRLETNASLQFNSDWSGRFRTTMIFGVKRYEDLSLRASRSANNNVKETYEVTPGYLWNFAPWMDISQDYGMYIQYTDYKYDALPSVNQDDEYNKRGTLTTRVTMRPSERLSLTISHEYNARSNASRTRTDAAGTDFYRTDIDQRISTVNLSMTFKPTNWLRFESATFRTKDLKDTFGTTVRTDDLRSGEIWLGGAVNRRWGSRELAATFKRHFANGPNVQESNARYWDADVSFSWKF
jgi:hypothetical protein